LPYSDQTIKTILDFIYGPDQIKLREPISPNLYMELIEIAKISSDNDLRTALKDVLIDTRGIEDIGGALDFAILHEDKNLVNQIFNLIKDERIDNFVSNQIISHVKKNNALVISALRKVKSSELF
jgi:hypothetical protein